MSQREVQAFAVAALLVSAFVGWSIGQLALHVARVLSGVP